MTTALKLAKAETDLNTLRVLYAEKAWIYVGYSVCSADLHSVNYAFVECTTCCSLLPVPE